MARGWNRLSALTLCARREQAWAHTPTVATSILQINRSPAPSLGYSSISATASARSMGLGSAAQHQLGGSAGARPTRRGASWRLGLIRSMTASVRASKRPPPPLNCGRCAKLPRCFLPSTRGAGRKSATGKRSLDLYVHPKIGNVAIADVGVPHVLKCVEKDWARVPETMRRVLGRLEELIDYARIGGLRRDDSNPARWVGGIDALLPPPSKIKPVEHHAALHYRDVPGFMAKLRAEPGVAARALGIFDPDHDAHERNAPCQVAGNRGRCLDHPAIKDENAEGEHRVPLPAPRLGNLERASRPACRDDLPRLGVLAARLMTTPCCGCCSGLPGRSRRMDLEAR